MDNRFTQHVLIADGTLNLSAPRTDGRKGTAMYGTLHINLAAAQILEALANGETSIAIDLSVWERTRKDGSGKFYGVQSNRVYKPEAAAAPVTQTAAG